MAQWHAQIGGQRYGPVSEEEMRSWIAQGRVKPTDYVWSEGMANWVPAGAAFGQTGAAFGQVGAAGAANAAPPQVVYVSHSIGGPLPAAPGASTAMVCGIIGVAVPCSGLVLGIIALQNAKKARAAIAANPGMYGGEGMATAGHVLGIIGVIIGGLAALYVVAVCTCMGSCCLGGLGGMGGMHHGLSH